MDVQIGFSDKTYQGDYHELFQKLNVIIERAAPILTKHGGIMFNITARGCSAVFKDSPEDAVKAAVELRHELMESKAESGDDEKPELRIALDKGSVAAGVVGPDSHISPMLVSRSLNTTHTLIKLSEKLDANILCTAAVSELAGDCRLRYIGKTKDGYVVRRVYEIFEADPVESREAKEKTKDKFGEGVFAIYDGDFSKAKAVFGEITENGSADSVASYYLSMAEECDKDKSERDKADKDEADNDKTEEDKIEEILLS